MLTLTKLLVLFQQNEFLIIYNLFILLAYKLFQDILSCTVFLLNFVVFILIQYKYLHNIKIFPIF